MSKAVQNRQDFYELFLDDLEINYTRNPVDKTVSNGYMHAEILAPSGERLFLRRAFKEPWELRDEHGNLVAQDYHIAQVARTYFERYEA